MVSNSRAGSVDACNRHHRLLFVHGDDAKSGLGLFAVATGDDGIEQALRDFFFAFLACLVARLLQAIGDKGMGIG